MDTVSLVTESVAARTSVVLASREGPARDLGISELHLEPLSPEAVEELIQLRVGQGTSVRPLSRSFSDRGREEALASTELLDRALRRQSRSSCSRSSSSWRRARPPTSCASDFSGADGGSRAALPRCVPHRESQPERGREVQALLDSAGRSAAEWPARRGPGGRGARVRHRRADSTPGPARRGAARPVASNAREDQRADGQSRGRDPTAAPCAAHGR